MQPFNPDAFIAILGRTRVSFESWLITFGAGIVGGGSPGNCNDYQLVWYNTWRTLPGFTDVPDSWYKLYYEYRTILKGAVDITAPIEQVCLAGGGTISEETDRAIIAYFDSVITSPDRLRQMIAEAEALK